MRHQLLIIFFSFVVFSTTACTPRAPVSPTPAPPPLSKLTPKITLEPGDLLIINVWGEKDLTGQYQVSGKGTLDFPLVGRLNVNNLTPSELASLLTKKLSKGMLKNPQVSIYVPSYTQKRYFVIWGQVHKPGTYPYSEGMSIIRAISLAGGMSAIADIKGVTITRIVDGVSKTFTVPVIEGNPSHYPIQIGDVIFVPERYF